MRHTTNTEHSDQRHGDTHNDRREQWEHDTNPDGHSGYMATETFQRWARLCSTLPPMTREDIAAVAAIARHIDTTRQHRK
ncbi:hypothetical protein ACFPM7_22885 [Actinokineospora guangxiensis]|uniref:Uncharacterized protein n=1 Tax=Actinokineospora guangxiensis TaxID=1490288 RepID=A0ABW0EVH9_9PSEU